jgi:hypothetical protein
MEFGSPPSNEEMGGEALLGVFREALGFLNGLFGAGGVRKLANAVPNHPAVRQASVLEPLASGTTTRHLPDSDPSIEVADYFLDFRLWPRSRTDDFWGFIDDAKARERVKRQLRDAEAYEETLTEVDVWAALRSRGFHAVLREDEGLPDIRVDLMPSQCWVEVKHVRAGTNPRNVGTQVSNANRQLRRASADQAGLLLLRIGRTGKRASLDERTPTDVSAYVDEVHRELSGQHNRSVFVAILDWVEYEILDNGGGRAIYIFTRRWTRIFHANPRSVPPLPIDSLGHGRRVELGTSNPSLLAIRPEDHIEASSEEYPPFSDGHVLVTAHFRVTNEWLHGIRPQHAIEAVYDPDSLSQVGRVNVFSRGVPSRDYMLVVLTQETQQGIEVLDGFRVYGFLREESAYASLQRLLKTCGVLTHVGGETALFHPYVIAADPWARIAVPVERGRTFSLARRREDRYFEIHCAFAIDLDRYRATFPQVPLDQDFDVSTTGPSA